MFDLLRRLFPRGRAWKLLIDNTLRKFVEGIANALDAFRVFVTDVYFDLFPQSTRQLDLWELQFGLQPGTLTEAQRRDRLEATWAATGGQSPRYIQDTLQAAGFDVWVHEWWDPADEPAVGVKTCVTARDPRAYLAYPGSPFLWLYVAGDGVSEAGDGVSEAGASSGASGKPLVNIVRASTLSWTYVAGDGVSEAGDGVSEAGANSGVVESVREYIVPDDPEKHKYFLYICGENFPDIASIDPNRCEELEALILKICPTHLWVGLITDC